MSATNDLNIPSLGYALGEFEMMTWRFCMATLGIASYLLAPIAWLWKEFKHREKLVLSHVITLVIYAGIALLVLFGLKDVLYGNFTLLTRIVVTWFAFATFIAFIVASMEAFEPEQW